MEIKIVLNINDKEITLTEQEAKELQTKLNEIFVQQPSYPQDPFFRDWTKLYDSLRPTYTASFAKTEE